jgi:hypothetical protein
MSIHTRYYGYPRQNATGNNTDAQGYQDFDATQLYCPRCRQAVSVRKRLLLVLPEGEKYEYLCSICYTSVGTKIDRKSQPLSIIT